MRLAVVLSSFVLAVLTASAATTAPTYNRDIAPILYRNCATCHRPGEVAPFSLLTYRDTGKRAALIAAVTQKRVMPPWKAEPGYGDFKDSRRLTGDQIALLQQWAKNGAPEGDPAEKPTPPAFPDGWQLGQPEKVFTMPATFSVAADGPDQYRCFVIPLNLERDAYVGSIEFRPGNRSVVHHALVFADPNHSVVHHALVFADPNHIGSKLATGSPGGSYSCFGSPGFPAPLAGGWAPGAVPAKLDPGTAISLRKGSDLVLQIHYHPSGRVEEDRSSLGLTFTGPPTKGRTLLLLGSRDIDIPPGDTNYVVKASVKIPMDVELAAIAPHAHYLCKDMKVNAYLPDGSVTPLIWIKDWDFNWQGSYHFAKPVKLPKGTHVDLVYTYDNSENNPRNPSHPPVRVTWGEQTTNEMTLAFMSIAVPTPADAVTFQKEMRLEFLDEFLARGGGDLSKAPPEIGPQQLARLQQAIQYFDKNQNGKLDDDERAALINFLRSRMR